MLYILDSFPHTVNFNLRCQQLTKSQYIYNLNVALLRLASLLQQHTSNYFCAVWSEARNMENVLLSDLAGPSGWFIHVDI